MKKKSFNIRVKRIYDEPGQSDGRRVLVDRLWPRGLSKEKAMVDVWVKEIAPSNQLRQWYGHDPEKWPEFKSRYAIELESNQNGMATLLAEMQDGPVTFLFSSKETRLNNAVALQEYLESQK